VNSRNERGVTPFDVLLDLALDEPDLALRARCVLANDDVDEVAALLSEPHCAVGLSDAGAHVSQLCDAPQATDLLGNWVRGRKAISLEMAIRKLSGAQADMLGLPDRGYLRTGMCADVVVFDADTVAPGAIRRVRDFPANSERLTADNPTGVQHVLVNGYAYPRRRPAGQHHAASGSTRAPGGAPARPRRTVTLRLACSSSVTTRCSKSSSRRRAFQREVRRATAGVVRST
jgi:N-acyl-D-aspartate/D-glutamate deacylase